MRHLRLKRHGARRFARAASNPGRSLVAASGAA
jgi:hypothetical protein